MQMSKEMEKDCNCVRFFVIWYERREIKPIMIPYYLGYMVYNFTWVPIAIQGMINKNKTEWSHTQHTRTISMKELKDGSKV